VIKKVFLMVLQFALFSLVYVAGAVLPAFRLLPSHVATWADGTKFEWDGVLLTLVVYVLIVVIEAARKRLRSAAPWTTLALVLAALVEFFVRLGVATPDR
jgi:hypothetical protein